MKYLEHFFICLHIFSNSITLTQNWLIYRIVETPVDTIRCVINNYYGTNIDNPTDLLID